MVSQFVGNEFIPQLDTLDFDFPENTHAIGRLDAESEGLLLLTTNKRVTSLLFNSKTQHWRTYLVQVRGKVTEETRLLLEQGIQLRDKGDKIVTTKDCKVLIVDDLTECVASAYVRNTYIEYTWLKISLIEGRHRQIRKMANSVRHKCVQLIRVSIEDMHLNQLGIGQVEEVEEEDFFKLLKIDNWRNP